MRASLHGAKAWIGCVAVLVICSCVIGGCAGLQGALPRAAARTLSISKVQAEPKTLDLNIQEGMQLSYDLSRPARVSVALVDDFGQTIRTIQTAVQKAGANQLLWDGRDKKGNLVPTGVYRYRVLASSTDGEEASYAPDETTGADEVFPHSFIHDESTGTFHFVLPHMARVRLRIGLKNFPHLRTLLDWEPMEAGAHTLNWDGFDSSGEIKLLGHPNVDIKLSAFALPDNSVIVKSPVPALEEPPEAFVSRVSTPSPVQPGEPIKVVYLHARSDSRHNRAICHDPRFTVEFPKVAGTTESGNPIVNGRVPVRVTLDARDKAHLMNRGFEVMFYVDTVFIFEEEQAMSPITFSWDTTGLTPGEHLLTVNILSYDDHLGVVTLPVVKKELDAS